MQLFRAICQCSTSWLMLALLASCANTSAIKMVEEAKITGKISGAYRLGLPIDAALHVTLQEHESSRGTSNTVASQVMRIDSKAIEQDYSLVFPADSIVPGQRYSLQACVTSSKKLLMVSRAVSVSSSSLHKQTDLLLLEQINLQNTFDLTRWIAEEETTLQSGIQSNLAGVCKPSATQYDTNDIVKASEVLETEWISGPHHNVQEDVALRGPHYLFTVQTTFGDYRVQGRGMLRRLIREVNAIAILREISKSDAFKEAFSEISLAPFGEFKEFILHPLDTVGGIVEGITTFVHSTRVSLTQGRSDYEDRYLEALLSVSKYKRRYAKQLNIDVYTSNPQVQIELNSIGWAAALGNWAPTMALMPLAGPSKLVYSAFGWADTFNRLVTEQTPDTLRYYNESLLKEMSIPANIRHDFLSHPNYSPRHHTIITGALSQIEGIPGIEDFLRQAIAAETELDAFAFQQLAELFMMYHQQEEKIARIVIHKGLPLALTQDRDLVALLPLDIGRWTPFAKGLFSDIGANVPAKSKAIWMTGQATDKFRENMARLGVYLHEGIEGHIQLMD